MKQPAASLRNGVIRAAMVLGLIGMSILASLPPPAGATGPPAPSGAPDPLPANHRAAGAAATEPGHPAGPGPHCNMDPTDCLLPFPDDWWTSPDATTVTGRRVDIPQAAMPSDQAG